MKRLTIFVAALGLALRLAHAAPVLETWNTPQGTPVYYFKAETLPMADIKVTFDAGSARDGKQYGLAALTSALLDTGAGDMDADAIAKSLEQVGAQLSSSVNQDFASISLRSLTRAESFQPALATLTTILREPTIAESDFKREQARTLAGLKHRQALPDDTVNRAFYHALYPNHPYGHVSQGEIETVGALTVKDIKAFHRRYYTADNALIVIVGDLDKAQAEATAKQLAEALPRGEKAPPLPEVPLPEQGGVQHIEFPSTQTHILSGMPGIKRTDPDYYALYLGNHILGGRALVSRLFEEVREKRGLAYSASSYFMPLAEAGPFVMGLQTRNAEAERALSVAVGTLTDFIDQGPSEAELESAKKNITGGFVMRYDSNAELAGYAEFIGFYHLPLDYLVRFPEQIQQQTVSSVRSAFQRHVQPDKLITITVGKSQAE